VEVAAVSDVRQEAAEALAARHGIPTVTTDYRRLIEDPTLDALVICVPNSLHRPVALAAAAAGKHVLCEKPLGLDFAEAEEMAAAVARAGVRGGVAFTYRYAPCIRYARHLVDGGHIGAVREIRAVFALAAPETWLEWRSMASEAGGALADLGSHLVDWGRWFVGEVSAVAAMTRTFLPTRPTAGGGPARRVDVDDAAALLVDFAVGATGVLDVSRVARGWGRRERGHLHLELNGSEGTLVCCLLRPFEIRAAAGRLLLEEDHVTTLPVPEAFLALPGARRDPRADAPTVGYRYDQALQFVHGIRAGRDLGPTFEDGARVQAVIDAAAVAARDRRWIPVPPAAPA
jgi:predicted dehydrogenase